MGMIVSETHSDDIVPIFRLVQQSYPILALHDGYCRISQEFGLRLELAGDEKAIHGTDIEKCRDGLSIRSDHAVQEKRPLTG